MNNPEMINRPINSETLGIYTNHTCNKNCKHCFYHIDQSDYKGFTKEDYKHLIDNIGDTTWVKSLRLSGGETLLMNDYEWFIGRILKDFPNAIIDTITNGKELHKFKHLFNPRCVYRISVYPNWNDDVVKEYTDNPNPYVTLKSYRGFYDITSYPTYSDELAKLKYETCSGKTYRLKGRRLYDCCGSEPIERCLNTKGASIEFTSNWRCDVKKLETWRTCKHCALATPEFRDASYEDRREFAKKVMTTHE